MSQTEQHLKRLLEKLQLLLKQQAALQKENEQLHQALKEAQKKIGQQQQHTDELRQQVSILKASAGNMGEADKKEFEKRINGYLKEIDKCIALLGE